MPKELGRVLLEDARIIFRNFSGKEGPYNREGDRNFAVVLDPATADQMEADGWNVKRKPARDEGEEPLAYLSVAVNFKGRQPPQVVLITSRGRTPLDESMVELIDYADIRSVDLILNPYEWVVSGKSGVKAYLKSIFVIIEEDALELKYAGVPEIGAGPQMDAIEAPQMLAIENYQDAEIVED